MRRFSDRNSDRFMLCRSEKYRICFLVRLDLANLKNEFFLFFGENKTRLTVEIAALRASPLTPRRTKPVGTVRQRRPQ